MSHTVYVGLGSNLDNPIQQIKQALLALNQMPQTTLLTHSALYHSAPLGPPQPDYINAVAVLSTQLSPLALLSQLQTIETQQGRIRSAQQRWGPRTLDLDILLYDNRQSSDPVLTLPHPGLCQRTFVLYPLYECAPQLRLPNGQRLQDLIAACPPQGLAKLAVVVS
jgi:2-amino-4-hydroxy-6-hydroxymethyldihydropteridine diphosphokinase